MSNLGKQFDAFPAVPLKSGFWCDFDTDEDLNEFVFTVLAGGSWSVLDTQQHGSARITGAATTNVSGGEAQWDAANFALATSKRSRLIARLQVSDSTNSDAYFGAAVIDTSIIASAPTDGIWFRKVTASQNVDCIIQAGSVTIASALGAATMADATPAVFAIDIQMSSTPGRGTVTFYKDSTSIFTATVSGLTASMLAPFAALRSGNATGTKTMDVDFIGVDQDR